MQIDHRYIKNIGTHSHKEIDDFMAAGFTSPKAFKLVVDAEGDGDFVTITEALAALGTAPGTIKIREGNYINETTPLILHPSQHIVGSGYGATVIKPQAGASGNGVFVMDEYCLFESVGKGNHISDLTIDGSETTNAIDGIYSGLNSLCTLVIERVRVEGMSGSGITILCGVAGLRNVICTLNRQNGLYLGASPAYGNAGAVHGTFDSVGTDENGLDDIANENHGVKIYNGQALMFNKCFSQRNHGYDIHAFTDTAQSQRQTQLSFVGCLQEGGGAGEIYIEDYLDVRIAENFALSVNGTNAYHLKGCDYVSLMGNEAQDALYGYLIDSCTYLTASGNIDRNCTNPIHLIGGDGLSIGMQASDKSTGIVTYASTPINCSAIFYDIPLKATMVTVINEAGVICAYAFYANGSIIRSIDGKGVVWV